MSCWLALAEYVEAPNTSFEGFVAFVGQRLNQAQLAPQTISTELLERVWRGHGLQVSAVCAVVGGIVAAEILKVLSGKDEPLDNVIVYDSDANSAVVQHIQP